MTREFQTYEIFQYQEKTWVSVRKVRAISMDNALNDFTGGLEFKERDKGLYVVGDVWYKVKGGNY